MLNKPYYINITSEMDDNDDPTNITSIAKIINKRKVDNKLNLDAIERDLIGTSALPIKAKDPEIEYNEILRDIHGTSNTDTSKKHTPEYTNQTINLDDVMDQDDSDESMSEESPQYPNPIVYTSSLPYKPNLPTTPEPTSYVRPSTYETNPAMSAMPAATAGAQHYMQPRTPTTYYRQPQISVPYEHTNHMSDALRVYNGDMDIHESMVEREKIEERKEIMIADIDDLRDELDADEIDTSRVPVVNMDSRFEDVVKVYKTLKRKYDRSRCEDLGKGVVMATARMLEMVFDGKKNYFGYRPDMTGWHRTVRSKMRRMRYEQSVLVSEFIEKYKIGPLARMGLELVPSAFLYSLTRREQHGQSNYNPNTSAGDKSSALDDLREFE